MQNLRLQIKEGDKMNNKTKKILHSSEFYVGVIIILFCLLIQARSGQFFTGNNLVDILRSFTIPVMFCMGADLRRRGLLLPGDCVAFHVCSV